MILQKSVFMSKKGMKKRKICYLPKEKKQSKEIRFGTYDYTWYYDHWKWAMKAQSNDSKSYLIFKFASKSIDTSKMKSLFYF